MDYYDEVNETIGKLRRLSYTNPQKIMQHMEGEFCWYITCKEGQFFIEKYRDAEFLEKEPISESCALAYLM